MKDGGNFFHDNEMEQGKAEGISGEGERRNDVERERKRWLEETVTQLSHAVDTSVCGHY